MNRFNQVKKQIHAGSCRFVLSVVAAVSYAENGPDLMTGTWKLNPPRSSGALQRSETLVIPNRRRDPRLRRGSHPRGRLIDEARNHAKYNDGKFHSATDRETRKAINENHDG